MNEPPLKHTQTKKHPNQLHIYVPVGYRLIVEEAKRIAKREGKSISKIFMEHCERLVRLEATPQTQLTKFGVQTKITQECSYPNCHKTAEYLDRAEHGGIVYTCATHHESALQRGLLKASKRL